VADSVGGGISVNIHKFVLIDKMRVP